MTGTTPKVPGPSAISYLDSFNSDLVSEKVKTVLGKGAKGSVVNGGKGSGKGGKGSTAGAKAVNVVQRPEPYAASPRSTTPRPAPAAAVPNTITVPVNMAALLVTARAIAGSAHPKSDDARELLAVKDKGWIDDKKFVDLLIAIVL